MEHGSWGVAWGLPHVFASLASASSKLARSTSNRQGMGVGQAYLHG